MRVQFCGQVYGIKRDITSRLGHDVVVNSERIVD